MYYIYKVYVCYIYICLWSLLSPPGGGRVIDALSSKPAQSAPNTEPERCPTSVYGLTLTDGGRLREGEDLAKRQNPAGITTVI